MSYDLCVFEPSAAPRDSAAFRAWFASQTDWREDHGYGDVSVSSPALQSWFSAIGARFPCLQDPNLSDEQIDDPHVTDYSFGRDLIYLGFRWSVAEEAYDTVRRSAVEKDVGFYDVSGDEGDGEVFFPGAALRPPSEGAWRQVAADFRQLEGKQ